MGVTRQRYTVREAELSVLEAGPESGEPEVGEPVVLVHGIPACAELWRSGLSRLAAAGFRVYAPDLPGYGATRLPPSGDRSLKGGADLLAAWLRQEEIPPVWLVGHDIGGGVAQILEVSHPERIRRLTLSHAATEDSWQRMRELIPAADVRLLDRAGHFAMLDQEEAFYETLIAWRTS